MRKLTLLLLFVLAIVSAKADTITTYTITVTNDAGTSNGQTVTINGTPRMWTNSVTIPQLQIATTNTIGAAQTNLYRELIAYPASGTRAQLLGTNRVQIISYAALTVSVSSGWATIASSTQDITNATVVRVPYTVEGTSVRQYVGSSLVDYFGQATNTLAVTGAMVPFVNRSAAQTIGGVKTFTNTPAFNAGISINGTLGQTLAIANPIRIVSLSTNTNAFTGGISVAGNFLPTTVIGGYFSSPTFTNAINYGNAFSSVGSGGSSEQFGANSSASSDASLAVGNGAIASNTNSTAVGSGSTANGSFSTAIGDQSVAQAYGSIAIGANAEVTTGSTNSIAIGGAAQAAHTNSIAFGTSAVTSAANQIMLGSAGQDVVVNHVLTVGDSISNAVFKGSTTNSGTWSWSRTNNTGLANGNNSGVSIGTAQYVYVSGPSAAFTINGLAGGIANRPLKLVNRTGYNMTIANQSGTDPTPANRIETGIGGDMIVTNNPGVVELFYDATASRWVVF